MTKQRILAAQLVHRENLSSEVGSQLSRDRWAVDGRPGIALPNAQAVRDILKKHDIEVYWQDSSLGHEWANWRRYLAQTLPLMFKNTSGCD